MPPNWTVASSLPGCHPYSPVYRPHPSWRLLAKPYLAFSELLALIQILSALHEKLRDYKNTVYNSKVKLEIGKTNEYSLKYEEEDVTERILRPLDYLSALQQGCT